MAEVLLERVQVAVEVVALELDTTGAMEKTAKMEEADK
jgi:hypothetical protein